VRMGDAVVVIARTSGPGAFQLTDRVGVVRPAHCTALGKIILASLRPTSSSASSTGSNSSRRPRSRSQINPCCCANRRDQAQRDRVRRRRIQCGSAVRRRTCVQFHRRRDRRAGHFRSIWRMSDQVLQSRAKRCKPPPAGSPTSSAPGAWRSPLKGPCGPAAHLALTADAASGNIPSNNKKASLTFSHTGNRRQDVATRLGRREQ